MAKMVIRNALRFGFALGLVLSSAVPVPAQDVPEPPSRPLWIAGTATPGVFWRTPGGMQREKPESSPEIFIPAGRSAACVLDATSADWRGFAVLEIALDSEADGQVPILFRERDPDGVECWVVPAEVREGSQTIRIRLRAEPGGDLRPALPQRDREFNPEGEGAMDLTVLAASGDIRIRSLTLRGSSGQ